MIRSAAIQVGQIIKQEVTDFNDSNLFILQTIPEKILQKKQFPLVRIDALPTSSNTYFSNKKRFEEVGCQINLFVKTNKEMDTYLTQIEQILSSHQFECFFSTTKFVNEYDVHHLIIRVQKYQNLKGVF
ncbi:hypothetical protein DS832_06960 [Bombilactobacillus bombi]|uniref:DUF806 family protein n=1 Tax=Bombilactobacillus bombi TaxID=1303590 RepID=A0A3R6W651_9LACO|nr:hypothetical protein [Bombilactobacillus bombi]RHW46083.1 hypothetical protein DS832_06960 [Bombilactobacillus bombi]